MFLLIGVVLKVRYCCHFNDTVVILRFPSKISVFVVSLLLDVSQVEVIDRHLLICLEFGGRILKVPRELHNLLTFLNGLLVLAADPVAIAELLPHEDQMLELVLVIAESFKPREDTDCVLNGSEIHHAVSKYFERPVNDLEVNLLV